MSKSLPHYFQTESNTCGLFCLKILFKYHGVIFDEKKYLNKIIDKGLSMYDLCRISENQGFMSKAFELTVDDLENFDYPVILHWDDNHYVVLLSINKNEFVISDPAKGTFQINKKELKQKWINDRGEKGKLIYLESSKREDATNNMKSASALTALNFLYKHLLPYKKNIKELIWIMVIISMIYAVLPFVSRSIIDIGVEGRDFDFITIILIANIALLIFKSVGEWIKATISLHIASRIKISIITEYFIKIFSLPANFLEGVLIGDIIQRSRDQERIQQFVSNSAISIIMSLLIIIIYGVILLVFNNVLFLFFLCFTLLYVIWVMFFYQVRKKMDIKYYELMGENQSSWIELLKNYEDIKLNNYSLNRRWKWEKIQGSIYEIGIKLLNVDRVQKLGADFINGVKDISLTFYSAYLVIEGEITFGTLISVQFIIGQLGVPVSELINFIRSSQSAFISFLRINEIERIEEEQKTGDYLVNDFSSINNDIVFKNVSFRYRNDKRTILNNISFRIPENKTTMIVGASGSGKSTIMKLLTKTYGEYGGNIYLGNENLKNFDNFFLRKRTGIVLQDSALYSDTILNNIVLSEEDVYTPKLVEKVLRWVNFYEEVYLFPKALNTILSEGGKGLSQGQKQRLLLARALFKRPKFLFLDEVTNAIDSISEKKIMDLFSNGLKNQTIVMISHKLSTIKYADHIIVVNGGKVIETGNYAELASKKDTHFYNLFSEQIKS
ncbi:ATP-binding cassette domain-containing protein [Tenacibaculum finnmarkense genomovar ulcerans]|uniref:peptidase domain-containing ABC transporter n=1 Tax=Tenacibaculum finnmarkense TaxID=2781243 RepID=UPI00187B719E|nr:peptidase domain-containing ABC transporter [Tenacibaculum finnmarkense]MBE7633163.1 ATP-binding cassette domain-containing protein [Tenacibaculum finnmarkense genomovar ulcerans]MCD8429077.1 peptidase domain-containing ABC transporter [Tenacibaculum finnmarkense genomovar ulcerans]